RSRFFRGSFFTALATSLIYTLSLHDALPILLPNKLSALLNTLLLIFWRFEYLRHSVSIVVADLVVAASTRSSLFLKNRELLVHLARMLPLQNHRRKINFQAFSLSSFHLLAFLTDECGTDSNMCSPFFNSDF